MIGIYKITNNINGKVYIGLSTNIEKRWNRHKSAAFNPKDKNYQYPLYQAMRKYGLNNFSFEVIEECSICDLNDKEIYYIAFYDSHNRKNGYNQDSGGLYVRHGKLTEKMVEVIKERIRTSTDLFTEIAAEFGLHENTIQNINSGRTWRMDNEQYPIRAIPIQERSTLTKQEKTKTTKTIGNCKANKIRVPKEKAIYYCSNCGKQIATNAKYCVECVHVLQQRVKRPNVLELAAMVKELGFEATGRKFGVCGNTIKKWCKAYHIPNKLNELIDWYNNQMGIVPEQPKVKRKICEIVHPVNQIDKNTGKILNMFKSATEATRYLGYGRCDHIIEVCKGKRKSTCGYYWKFA